MKKQAFCAAFPCTLPVLMGYLFLGIAFGVLLAEKGFSPLWALLMSVFIYAGSMQFAAIGLLTDETYSLLCVVKQPDGMDRKWFLFFISVLDQTYWIIGSCIGGGKEVHT